MMVERTSWSALRARRMGEEQAQQGYDETQRAHELGAAVRELRSSRGWTQTQLAAAAGMTQSAVARFEAGGTVPTLAVLARLAQALDADLTVSLTPRSGVA
jgi:ribosome-binding protein aMBF1 (putative translation factor)